MRDRRICINTGWPRGSPDVYVTMPPGKTWSMSGLVRGRPSAFHMASRTPPMAVSAL
jgi:hypothetical protein